MRKRNECMTTVSTDVACPYDNKKDVCDVREKDSDRHVVCQANDQNALDLYVMHTPSKK